MAKGVIAKINSQNLFKLLNMEPLQAYCSAIFFSDTLSEMALNFSDIEQKIQTMFEKCPKKKTQMDKQTFSTCQSIYMLSLWSLWHACTMIIGGWEWCLVRMLISKMLK